MNLSSLFRILFIMSVKANTKYPNFDNWKKAILLMEFDINNKIDLIERENCISKIILYFIKINKESKIKKDLLTAEEIKVLSSISVESSSIGNYIPISKYLDFNNIQEDNNIKNNVMKDENVGSPFSSSSNNSESENSLISNENEENINDKNEDSYITVLFKSLDEETDLCYNIQKNLNTFNLDLDLNK